MNKLTIRADRIKRIKADDLRDAVCFGCKLQTNLVAQCVTNPVIIKFSTVKMQIVCSLREEMELEDRLND